MPFFFSSKRIYFMGALLAFLAHIFCSFADLADIYSYLHNSMESIESIETFETNGATNCSYYFLRTKEGNFFVKAGEKVSKEIKNITFLTNQNIKCIPKLIPGTSLEENIMITEFIPQSKFGLEMVEALHAGSLTFESFLIFQHQAIDLLKGFYQVSLDAKDKGVNHVSVFSDRVQQRIDDLLADQDTIVMKSEAGEVSLRSILTTPIIYRYKNETWKLPNLLNIVQDFAALSEQLPSTGHCLLHGDFHAPNLCRRGNELILVDLSDLMYGEDPAWDLGKWVNHLTRFYRVVSIRGEHKPDPLISFSYTGSHLLIDNKQERFPQLMEIRNAAVRQFAVITKNDEALVCAKTAAAEFIVNLSTLRRHMTKFPDSTRGVLSCIVESYLEFKRHLKAYNSPYQLPPSI